MNRVRFGIVAGLVFGVLDIIPMFAMTFPSKAAAISGAFINRFAIGFIIPQVTMPISGLARGIAIALLLSMPDAIITGAWGPILATGLLGGAVIGYLVGRAELRARGVQSPKGEEA